MLDAKLMQFKTVKLGGVKFVIRKLNPAMFIDQDFFPVSNIEEMVEGKKKISEEEAQLIIQEHKEKVKDIILKSVIKVKYWWKSSKIDKYVDYIMETVELYNALFVEILNHSLGNKKKTPKIFDSIERLPFNSIN